MNKLIKITVFIIAVLFCREKLISSTGINSLEPRKPSAEECRLEAEFNAAKLSGDRINLQEIQNKFNLVIGNKSQQAGGSIGTFEFYNKPVPPFTGDNINIVEMSTLKGIRALATATEQRGQNTGRVWVSAAVSNTPDADTIYYFYSDNGGTVWNLYTSLHFSNSYQMNYDQMDMEIIEDNIGDKYIWTVYGLNAPNGKQFVGANVIRTPTFQGNAFVITFPGENLSNTDFGRFRPRITSDNAKFNNTASVYISISSDTTVSGGSHKGWFNYVLCVNPYTTNPVLDYYGRNTTISTLPTPTDLHTDIASVYNGGDSLVFVSSNYWSAPEQVGLNVVSPHFGSFNQQVFDGANNFAKQYARVATCGGTNLLKTMFVYMENYQNTGDWDIKSYQSTINLYSWFPVSIDVRRDNVLVPNPPDICGVRNRENRFYIAYTNSGLNNFDTVKYLYTSQSTLGIATRTISHLSAFARPKPGFRLVNNDSCFAVWSQKGTGGGNNIWVSEGCTGPITIGIENLGNEVPRNYKLEQNYPNPFNPVTNIKFSIPKPGLVKLVIYNLLGEEVESPVNEILQQGNYKVDFNAGNLPSGVYFYRLIAGNFSETKSMVLIK